MGITFITQSRVVSATAGQDAWIAVILGAIFPLLSILLIERLGRRFPNMDFTEISQALFGKILGALLAMVFIIFSIPVVALVVHRFADLISLYLLPKTPLSVLCFMILAGAVYVASKGAKVVARVNELLFYLYLPLFLLIIPPFLAGADYTNLLPVGGAGVSKIMQGSLSSTLDYGNIQILMVAYFMVTRKNEVLKAGLSALTFVTLSYVLVTVTCLIVFGAENLQTQMYPLIGLFKVVSYPILERMDLLFMVSWSVAFRPAINVICMVSFSFTRLFRLDEKKHYPLVATVIGFASYILTFIPKNILEVMKFFNMVGYISLILGLGYPLLYHLVAAVRGEKVKQNV